MILGRKKIGFMLMALLCACSGGTGDENPEAESTRKEIKISFGVQEIARATDQTFELGDKIGLYVVNREGGQGQLLSSGNYVDNMRFAYNGSWTPDQSIYWKDDETKADFYAYYLYINLVDAAKCVFSVKADQTALTDYKASDFLLGKTLEVFPTERAVDITLYHVFSCARVKVAPGDGFTQSELDAANVQVKLNHVRLTASINLATGKVQATGDEQSIVLGKNGNYYRALVVPQNIEETNLLVINVNGKDYALKKGLNFEPNKRYTFTVKVNKTSSGININIGQWDDDGEDYGGNAK